jgi:hypothetical protein
MCHFRLLLFLRGAMRQSNFQGAIGKGNFFWFDCANNVTAFVVMPMIV